MNNIWAIPLAAIYLIAGVVFSWIFTVGVFYYWLGLPSLIVYITSAIFGGFVGMSTLPFYFWLRDR